MLTRAERGQLVRAAVAWLESQRRRHRPRARCLTAAEISAYGGWFPARLLSRVRLRVVDKMQPPPLPAPGRGAGRARVRE
jgi:hypothetical protein